MKVEIWSDLTCIHCYTSRQKLGSALTQFKNKDKIEIVWKSFELAPGMKTDSARRFPEFFAELQGISLAQVTDMVNHVTNTVREVGLAIDMNKAIPANSFNAHRLSHLAKARHLQDSAEEKLFKAYFADGKNIDDIPTLVELAIEIGLDATEAKAMLESTKYTDEVLHDINEAKQAGITSIPHFVFNGKTRVSGAQDSKVFLETLERTFSQWQIEGQNPISKISGGQSCTIGENCA